ncbi:MAG: MerR family transcriptional regulator [Bacteroidota bacterium]
MLDNIKKYYAIGEVAQRLNVSPSMIRFWEKKFPALQPHKNKQGTRRYTQADIEQIKKIYQLVKKQGYTLQGAREAMRHSGEKLQGKAAIIQQLKSLRDFLVLLKKANAKDAD